MREKCLVTFRMAPKRSSGRGKKKEATEPTMADGWKKNKLSESDIASLVDERLLQSSGSLLKVMTDHMKGPQKPFCSNLL